MFPFILALRGGLRPLLAALGIMAIVSHVSYLVRGPLVDYSKKKNLSLVANKQCIIMRNILYIYSYAFINFANKLGLPVPELLLP